jgi:hypothetical protein
MVQTRLTAAQNIVSLYQAIGGDALLQGTPLCQPLPGDRAARVGQPLRQCSAG